MLSLWVRSTGETVSLHHQSDLESKLDGLILEKCVFLQVRSLLKGARPTSIHNFHPLKD